MTTQDPQLSTPARAEPAPRTFLLRLSGRQWAYVLSLQALGAAILMLLGTVWHDGVAQLLPAVLFVLLPLIGLRQVAPAQWLSLFAGFGWRALAWGGLFGLANICVSLLVALLFSHFFSAADNPAVVQIASLGAVERALFLLKTLPQLFGEELLTILPLLALLQWLHLGRGWTYTRAVLAAWLLSALLFSLLHLPTYDWHLLQCVLIIGSARLVLSLAYLYTRNIWVSTYAHIVSDWAYFSLSLLGSGLATQA